jgi:hypothetical protein
MTQQKTSPCSFENGVPLYLARKKYSNNIELSHMSPSLSASRRSHLMPYTYWPNRKLVNRSKFPGSKTVSAQPNPSLSLAATHMHVLKDTKYIIVKSHACFTLGRSCITPCRCVRACALAAAEQPRRTSKAGTARYRMPTAHIPCSDCLPRPDPSIRTRATTGMATTHDPSEWRANS